METLTCPACGRIAPPQASKLVCCCTSPPTIVVSADRQRRMHLSEMMSEIGPGTLLKKKLFAVNLVVKLFSKKTCQCDRIAAEMNELGPIGCEEKVEEIVDKIKSSSESIGMQILFDRDRARKLVLSSASKSRRKIKKHRYSYAYQE